MYEAKYQLVISKPVNVELNIVMFLKLLLDTQMIR